MIGVSETTTPFIIFCDSSNIIKQDFVALALSQFEDLSVSACFGRIVNHESLSESLTNWRGRHLFGQNKPYRKDVHQVDCLITYAVLLRKEHVIRVGNFNPALRQCEDQDLGEKLIKSSYKLISDPALVAYSIRQESFKSLCIRYHRWYSKHDETKSALATFYQTLKVAFFIFAREDLKERNFKCLVVSFCLPFYLFFKNLFSKDNLNKTT